MNKENCNVSNNKPRFKAIENFLRRVAFNLGNTPSQTEVKIISCIPVDVSDLQQKIFQLQKELEESKCCKKVCPVKTPPCHTTTCENNCSTCRTKRCENPNVKVICSVNLADSSSVSLVSLDSNCSSCKQLSSSISLMDTSRSSFSSCKADHIKLPNTRCWKLRPRNFLKKKKACKKCKTHFVYRAKTDTNTPFRTNISRSSNVAPAKFSTEANKSSALGRVPEDATSDYISKDVTAKDTPTRTYFEQMVQKQYQPQLILNGFSNLSEFSSPVCRDNIPNRLQNLTYESDICSCFHDRFQNIDKHINNDNNFKKIYPTCEAFRNYNRNTYYDSKFYDLVPVKENTEKIRNDIATQKRKEPSKQTIKCWPEKVRPKYKVLPMATDNNNYTVTTARDRRKKRIPHGKSHSRKDIVMNKMAAKPIRLNPPRSERDIDLGQIYSKRVTKQKEQNDFSTSMETRNVGTCSPTTLTSTDCQTSTSKANANCQSSENPPEDKTESTLNEIKDILQSVLTEIKTNSKLAKSVELAKKDAVVQNGPSQGNVFGASQLLNSYTYSPYNMNPYLPSCSHQITSNTYTFPEYPGLPGTHLQQYPLLIQHQKRMCNNCLRNVTKTFKTKHATSASTNTEQIQERNKETERLIKEIYNSMALHLEVPSSKDNTVGEYTKPKPAGKKSVNSVKVENNRESKSIANTISEIFRNKYAQDSSTMTANTATTIFKNIDSNETKFKRRRAVEKVPITKRMYSQRNNSNKEKVNVKIEQNSRETETEELSDSNFDEDSSSETESGDLENAVQNAKKEKSSIFKKMFKIFQPKQHSLRRIVNETENESESDSVDYQTDYSQKVATPKPKTITPTRIKPHSRVIYYSRQPQQKKPKAKISEKQSRNSPYLEQEYRRYWDEKLMFHENQRRRYSTDVSRDTSEYQQNRPVYYQNYEARPVLINPLKQIPPKPDDSADNIAYNENKNIPINRPKCNGNTQTYNKVLQKVNSSNPAENSNGGSKPRFIIFKSNGLRKNIATSKGLAWMKKHTMCQQWKELIRDG